MVSYNRKGRRYGVIECDPLVHKGLEKTVSGISSSRVACISCLLITFFCYGIILRVWLLYTFPFLTFLCINYKNETNICLSKQGRHMIIPYMPMLVPPLNWRGYGFHISAFYMWQ